MIKERLVFKITRGIFTTERKNKVAGNEVFIVGRPTKIVLVAGGAYLFFLGTSGDVPEAVVSAAVIFTVLGIALVLVAIFIQLLINMRYISKAAGVGAFPEEVSVTEGGVYITGTGSNEKFLPFSAVGRVEEQKEYFKLNLSSGGIPEVFIFKKDFGQGEPEAFKNYISVKRSEN